MKNFFLAVAAIFLGSVLAYGITAADELPLPNPVGAFEHGEIVRVKPTLETRFLSHTPGESPELPAFVAGHKEVAVSKIDGRYTRNDLHCVSICIDEKQVGMITWWGGNEFGEENYGYPFRDLENDPPTLHINHEKQTVIYHKPYIDSQGNRAVFSYGLRPLDQSRVQIAWNSGSQDNVSPWLILDDHSNYRDCEIAFGGKTFRKHNNDELAGDRECHTNVDGDFEFNVGDPLNGYRIIMPELHGTVTEKMSVPEADGKRYYEICYRTESPENLPGKGSMIIDLGDVAMPKHKPLPPVRGLDFWKLDATDVPPTPTRNLMPNPSFEQGTRYWRWSAYGERFSAGEKPRYEIIDGGVSGKKALAINGCTNGASLQTFPLPLEPDKNYTLSFYAKSINGENQGIAVAIGNAAVNGGTYAANCDHRGPFGDVGEPESQFAITTEWQRYSRTFRGDPAGLLVRVFAADIMLDAFQLEEGDSPTEFVAPPIEGLLLTSKPDNDLAPDDSLDARFRLFGDPKLEAKVRITVFNAFRETLYREVFDISLDRSGEASIGLPLSTESLGQGIFLVKVEYAVPNMRAYRDYYRFSIMRPLENRHATKNMFGTLLDHCAQVSRGDEMAQKMMQWGWGSTTWTSFENMHDVDYVERMRKHRFTNMHTPLIEELVLKILPQPDKELNIYTAQDVLYSLDRVTPEMVRMTEEEAFRIVQQTPADLLPTTAFGNEEEGGTLPAINDGEDYFRLQQAVARGAKRARPDIGIAPTCGTAGYHVIHGFDAYERYLAVAQKHGFKYDAITIHVYGNIDRGVFSDHDLDEETSRLIDQMRRYGYGKETPILFTEGFNIASFGINPWAEDDRSGDFNSCGKPTYDFSRREFLHAASAARLYIISLKYWPQVQCLNIWQTQPFLDVDFSPLLLCKAVNTLGNEMGNVKFYSDVKLPDNIRGYLFTLEDETALALIWTSDRDVENGFKANPHIGVRFDQPVRFLDLMGCKRTAVPDENGVTTIPVTPAPLLIKAADVEKLSKALQNSPM